MKRITALLFIGFLLQTITFAASKDTLQVAKHFIRPTIYFNLYGSGKQKLLSSKALKYRFAQTNIGGYFPIYTKVKFNSKQVQSTFQIIGFGNILTSKPQFSFVDNNHRLTRLNIGANSIYTNGKNTFLLTLSPFKAHDKNSIKTSDWRMSWMFIYNRTVSDNFSFRVGYVRSFVLDGNINLPVVGFRIGRYDGVYLNAQFPRNVSLHVPINPNMALIFYGKVTGSIYNMRNLQTDTELYDKIVYRRSELQRGIELNYKTGKRLNFFTGGGFTSGRISLAEKSSLSFQKNRINIFSSKLSNTIFINFGFTYSFGSAKKVYNNQTLLDALLLNQQSTNSDLNGNSNFISPNKVPQDGNLKGVQIKDIEDLIDVDDLN